MGQDRPHPEGRQEGMGRVARHQRASEIDQAAGMGSGSVPAVFVWDSGSKSALAPWKTGNQAPPPPSPRQTTASLSASFDLYLHHLGQK